MTTSLSLTDKALALASWKKPCPGLAYGSEDFMHGSDCPFNCTDGEVYVLDASVRVECEYQRRMGAFHDEGPNGCVTCQGRGWVALDPRFGWDWMMALVKAGFDLLSMDYYFGPPHWEFSIGTDINIRADTPGDAMFLAAEKVMECYNEGAAAHERPAP